jgi:hydrolase, TatD family
MSIIDTHAHLYAEEFYADLDEVVLRAKEIGVEKVLLPNIDETSIDNMIKTTACHPDFFLAMMGLHPTSVRKDWETQLQAIHQELNKGFYIAIGEIGIDLYWDTTLREEQMNAFEEQLKWSIEKDLPVSLHFRNATEEVVKSIKRVGENSLRGVFHSFGGTKEELETILQLKNFWVGINGVVTFKNSVLSETLRHCPRNKVLLETDSPYLAPVPYRGKRNESSYLRFVIKKLAEIWQESEETVVQVTKRNALEIFSL